MVSTSHWDQMWLTAAWGDLASQVDFPINPVMKLASHPNRWRRPSSEAKTRKVPDPLEVGQSAAVCGAEHQMVNGPVAVLLSMSLSPYTVLNVYIAILEHMEMCIVYSFECI